MKAYGIPRDPDVQSPDKMDLKTYGMKSRTGHLPTKSGEYKNNFRNPDAKGNTRRIWKKRERLKAKVKIREET